MRKRRHALTIPQPRSMRKAPAGGGEGSVEGDSLHVRKAQAECHIVGGCQPKPSMTETLTQRHEIASPGRSHVPISGSNHPVATSYSLPLFATWLGRGFLPPALCSHLACLMPSSCCRVCVIVAVALLFWSR